MDANPFLVNQLWMIARTVDLIILKAFLLGAMWRHRLSLKKLEWEISRAKMLLFAILLTKLNRKTNFY